MKKQFWLILLVAVMIVGALSVHAATVEDNTAIVYVDGSYTGTDCDGTHDKPYTSLNAAIAAINAAKDANNSITDGKIIVKDDITVVGTANVTLTACKVPLEVTSANPAEPCKLTLNTHSSKRILYCTSEIEFNNVIFLVSRTTYTEIWSGPSLTFGENVSTHSGTTTEAPASDFFCVRMNGANPRFTMLSGTLNVLQGGNNSGDVTGTSTIVLGGTARVTHILQCSGTSKSVNTGNVTVQGNAYVKNLYINGHGTSKINNVDISITDATVDNIFYHRTTDVSATSSNVRLTLDNATVGSLAAKDSRVTNAEVIMRNGDYSSLTTSGWTVAKSLYVNQSYTGGDGVGTYAKPYTSVETAVSSLNSGESVELVIVGTYKPGTVWAFPTLSNGKITVTGYDESAQIRVESTGKPYWDFFSPVEFHDLTISYNHKGSSMELFAGPELTFGSGMVFLCDDCTTSNGIITQSKDGHICVRMGKRAVGSECAESKFSISSGTISYVQGGSRYGEVGDSYINIGGSAVITDHVQGSGTFHSVDNSHITITGGTVAQLAVGGYGATGTNKGPAKVIESSTISITGGTVNKITAYRGATQSNDVINSIDMTIGGTAVVGTMDITGVNITGTNELTIESSQNLTSGFGTFWDSITIGGGATVRVDGLLSMTQKNDQDVNVLTVKDASTLLLGVTNTAVPAYTREGTGKVVLESALNIRLTEVYLDQSKGLILGDGSADGSAAKPVSTLSDAYSILQDGTATIHLVGEYAITGAPGMYVFPYHNGKVTIVGTDSNAKINFDTTDKTLVQFSSATELKNLQWRFAHTGGNMDIYSGPELMVGDGVSFHCDGCGAIGENCIAIRGGYQKAAYQNAAVTSNDVSITVNSGTLSYVMGGNGVTDINGNATINIGGTAVIATRVMSAGANGNSVKGNVTINITGGEIRSTGSGLGLILIGHGASNKTCTVEGNVTVNISGGKVSQITANRTNYEKLKGDLTVNISGDATVGSIKLDKTFITEDKAQELNFGDNIGELELHGSFGDGWDGITIGENNTFYCYKQYNSNAALTVKAGSTLYLSNATNTAVPQYTSEGTGANAGKVVLFDAPDHRHNGDTWSGEKLTVLSTGGMQGTAVYGDWLLQAGHAGGVWVYNLGYENPGDTLVAYFRLASYNNGTLPEGVEGNDYLKGSDFANHANQMMFGATKFDENDPFPLLYVTTGNSGGHDDTGAYVSKCSVERIKYDPETNTWSAELVQTIEFNDFANIPDEIIDGVNVNPYKNQNLRRTNDPSEFLTKMRDPATGKFYYISGNGYDRSAGYQKIGWGWAASFVDIDPTEKTAGKFYLYSARYRTYAACDAQNRNAYGNGYTNYAEENAYIITEFNLPALPTSESDPNYGGTVTLYPRDITDQFETAYKIGGTQGGTMYQGKIYYPYGFSSNDNGFQIFDIANKALTASYRLGTLVPGEPEGTAVYQGKVIMSDGNKNIWMYNMFMENVVGKDATCTEAGTIDHVICNMCDQKFSVTDYKTVLDSVEDPSKPALNHSFTNYVPDGNATCEADGTKTAICDRDDCNEKDTVADAGTKLPHDLKDVTRVDATADKDGMEAHWICKACEKLFSDAEGKNEVEASKLVIPALGHAVEKETETGATIEGLENAVHGESYTFTVKLEEGYVKGENFKVMVNGKELKANADGSYTILSVTGKLEISVTGAVKAGENPNTGDETPIVPVLILMALSACGIVVMLLMKRRNLK